MLNRVIQGKKWTFSINIDGVHFYEHFMNRIEPGMCTSFGKIIYWETAHRDVSCDLHELLIVITDLTENLSSVPCNSVGLLTTTYNISRNPTHSPGFYKHLHSIMHTNTQKHVRK